MGNYESSSNERPAFRAFTTQQGDADSAIKELGTLANRQWYLYNNSGFGRGIVDTAVNTTVGTGLHIIPTIDANFLNISSKIASKWQSDVKRRFNTWAKSKDVDYYRLSDLTQLQYQALTTMLVDGDSLAVFARVNRTGVPYTMAIKLLEGVQLYNNPMNLANNKTAGGVTFNKNGIEKYTFYKHHPRGIMSFNLETVDIKAYTGIRQNIAHLMDTRRAGQRRGVGFLAPIVENLLQLKRMTEAELTSVITSSMLVAFIKTTGGFEEDEEDGSLDGRYDTNFNEYKLGNGTVVRLAEGEDMQMFDPRKKSDTFTPFMNAVLDEIAAGTQIPSEVLVKKFVSSYSASRGALLEMWKFMKRLRHVLVSSFLQPTYETWLLDEILAGRIKADGFTTDYFARKAWCGSQWVGSSQGLLNPVAEVTASEKMVKNGFSTRTEETIKLNGGDFSNNISLLGEENASYKDAIEILQDKIQNGGLV